MSGLFHGLVGLLLMGLCSAAPSGREFVTMFMENSEGSNSQARFLVEVAALPSSQGSTKVKVIAMGKEQEQDIEPGKSKSFQLPDSVEMRGSKKSHQTVMIEASQDVSVTSLNYKPYTADTSVVYPLQELGTEYFISTPPSAWFDGFKEFSIANLREANTVNITLQGSVTFLGTYYPQGSKLTLALEAFETVQMQSRDDLSGTRVVSRVPVAVSSGHTCVVKFTSCNHVYEQLLPVKRWGKEFVIAPLPYHNLFTSPYDTVLVQASQPTTISIDGVPQPPMKAGETFRLMSSWPNALYLTSDKAVQVLFEFNGGPDKELGSVDPFLMTILPTDRFYTSFALEGQDDFENHIIVVARSKDLAGIKIDPRPKSEKMDWHKVEGSEFSWAHMQYSTGANFHHITHPSSPFGVYSFGLASANAYGAPASAELAEKRDCSTTKCTEGEVCQMKGSSPTCLKKPPPGKPATCWAMGDPHYRTFDGHYYNFMGNCTYTMVKNCQVGQDLPAFEVDAQNSKRSDSEVTFVGMVIIKVYGFTVTMVRSEFGLVRMNHTLWNLPINLGDGKVKLTPSGLSVVVETDFGLTVQYDWKEYLRINVPGTLSGKVCGLCGNFNRKEQDDFVTSSGAKTSDVVVFGKSWRVPDGPHDAFCRDECPGHCETCKNQGFLDGIKDKMFCSLLTTVMNGPLKDCNAIIDSKLLHDMCLYDVCMGDGMMDFLCDTLQVYSDACQRAGIKIYDWRHLARCSKPTCPDHSHYEFCGTGCPATCENPAAAKHCDKNCVETCVCDEGFLLSGTKCVPKAQCGCSYKGFYLEAGDYFYTADCAEKCTCGQETKQVKCEKQGCRHGFECKIVNELYGCHPLTYAECSMTGGTGVQTFDRDDYNFNGTCEYQMAGVCSKDPTLPQFAVLVQRVDSGPKLVQVNISGFTIVLTRQHKNKVLINGKLQPFPVLIKGNTTVRLVGDQAEIETEFGLTVSYDWNSTAHVRVPDTYAGEMCGLCGNYNNNSKDDLKLKDGTVAKSAEELGKNWTVSCQKMVTCTISGDPHYKTFDQNHFDFQGTCSYTAATSCNGSKQHFAVVVENEKFTLTDQSDLSVAMLVAVEVYNHTFILRRNQTYSMMVDDVLTFIPFSLPHDRVQVFQEGFHYVILADFGLRVTYDMIYKVEVSVPERQIGQTCGLCGAGFDNKTKEYQLPDGQKTKDVKTFGAAWKESAPGVVCEDGCSGDQCPKCSDPQKKLYESACEKIRDPHGVLAACHSRLSPEYYFRDCVYDVCMSKGDRSVLCSSIAAYVSDCQSLHVRLDNWRSADFCPAQCSGTSQYDICHGACAYPCPGLANAITCPDSCTEGCNCKEGYFFNGTACVAPLDCSCFHEGRTFKVGEAVLLDDCSQRCTCSISGKVECEDYSCNATERCQVQNHILGCYAKQCRVEAGGFVTLFSGRDGLVSIMGAYEMVVHCDQASADWFRIVAVFKECGRSVAAVYVYFNDLSVAVTDKQEIWVNGKHVTSPSRPRANLSLSATGRYVVVELASVFRLSLGAAGELVVTVGARMADKVCGACDKLLPFRSIMGFTEGPLQEYMSRFQAKDFPSCGL